MVSSNHCVGPSPRIKMSFFLLSICTDELIPASKIMKHIYHAYLSRSVFLANLASPNKQSFKVKLVFNSGNHVSNS